MDDGPCTLSHFEYFAIVMIKGTLVSVHFWRFPGVFAMAISRGQIPYDTFTLYTRPKIHYTPNDEKYVCRVFVCLVPVFAPRFVFFLFLFRDFLFEG